MPGRNPCGPTHWHISRTGNGVWYDSKTIQYGPAVYENVASNVPRALYFCRRPRQVSKHNNYQRWWHVTMKDQNVNIIKLPTSDLYVNINRNTRWREIDIHFIILPKDIFMKKKVSNQFFLKTPGEISPNGIHEKKIFLIYYEFQFKNLQVNLCAIL